MTFEEFKEIDTVKLINSEGINISHFNPLPEYYDDYFNSKKYVSLMENTFSYLCSVREPVKYLEVEFSDGDVVCFVYKAIFFSNPSSLMLYEVPVSMHGNINHIKDVLSGISSKDFKTFMIIESSDYSVLVGSGVQFKSCIEGDTLYSNFYDSCDNIISTKDTQKFRTKYRFKFLNQHCKSDFKETLTEDEIDNILKLRTKWEGSMSQNVFNSKKFENSVKYSGSGTLNMITTYDNEVVHYNKLYIKPNGCVRAFSTNASRLKTDNEERNKDLMNIEVYTRVPLAEYLKSNGIDYMYHLGTFPNDKGSGLLMYKRRVHEGCVLYNKVVL